MLRRALVLLGIALLAGALVTVALSLPSRQDDGGDRTTPVRAAEPTQGQRSGIRPAGWEYEKPTHRPETWREDDDRPNIVLITTDDQALTDMAWMPRTRRWLGRQGVTFANMISPHPLCCPARAELLTGQFAQNNGVHTNRGPYGGFESLREPDNTLAAWLQESGYLMGMVGKYLNGYDAVDGVPTGWDHWNAATTTEFGYERFPMYENGNPRFHFRGYSTDLIRDDSVAMIEEWSATEQPFFLWSSYYAPHGVCGTDEGCANPPTPAPRHRGLYPDSRVPSMEKPSFNEPDVSDKSHEIRKLDPVDEGDARFLHRQRIRALAAVDQAVDVTMRTLRRTGELDNTVVLFTSDNGYLVGEHRYRGKVLPYEESIRVPLLVRGPGLPQGATRDQTVTTVDLAPTVVDIAGAEPGRVLDGRSVLPFVRGRDVVRDDSDILVQAGGKADEDPDEWWYRGVRNDRYTFVRWEGPHHFLELYDNRLDPFQLRNVAEEPRYRPVVREMTRRLEALVDCSGEECRQDFGPPPRPR